EFDGQITLRKALAESKNTVAVKLLIDVGIDKVRSEAHAAGILSDTPQSYTAALGTGEVGILEEINAYATLASQGKRAEAVQIKRNTGQLAKEGDPYAVPEVFMAGTEPTTTSDEEEPSQEDWYQAPSH